MSNWTFKFPRFPDLPDLSTYLSEEDAEEAPKEVETLRNIPVAAPVVVEVVVPEPAVECHESYYGTPCTNARCSQGHRLQRRSW